MKTVLLLLLVFSNGQSNTAAALFESLEACEKRKDTVREVVTQNNTTEKVKIVLYSAACTPLQEAPKGTST